MAQEQVRRPAPSERVAEPSGPVRETKGDTEAKLKADLDALLDEVDAVLEENAEEFVKGYVQKGGE